MSTVEKMTIESMFGMHVHVGQSSDFTTFQAVGALHHQRGAVLWCCCE